LLIQDIEAGTAVSVLDTLRCVETLQWRDHNTLDVVLAPPTDEGAAALKDLDYESVSVRHDDWLGLERRSIRISECAVTRTARPSRDRDAARRALMQLAQELGMMWRLRRAAWAVASTPDGGVVLGLESGIEKWPPERTLAPDWRIDLDGTCTQLLPAAGGTAVAAVWTHPDASFMTRSTTVVGIDTATGEHREILNPGHAAIVVPRRNGDLLVRDTRHLPRTGHPGVIITNSGDRLGSIDLSSYDLFNHYFDIRRAEEYLVLVGKDPHPHQDKWVAAVRRTATGTWRAHRLFPLAWQDGAHVFGGPGVWVTDDLGQAIVHAGTTHSWQALLRGNAFIARRRYPDGHLSWHVPLDSQITAIDEREGRIVAVTNLGELVVIDASTGTVLMREDTLTIDGHTVIPLSLTLAAPDRAWIGTLDGRAAEVRIEVNRARSGAQIHHDHGTAQVSGRDS
jgi:hypothetical protein